MKFATICLALLVLASIPVYGLDAETETILEPDFRYQHVQLTMELSPDDDTIRGVAAWQFTPLHNGEATLRFHTLRTEIHSVLINQQDADFYMSGDTLMISSLSALSSGTVYKLEILYRADPVFGMHRLDTGSLMSSLMPGAVSNLFPTPLQADLQVPVDVRMITPADWQAVANGTKMANILLPEGRRLYHWRLSQPSPVSQTGITAGQFVTESRVVNGQPLSVFAEHNTQATEAERAAQQAKLVETADLLKRLVESSRSVTGKELPFGAMNVFLTDDLIWNVAPFGSALAYVSHATDDLAAQLLRALTHQFAGAHLRSSHPQTNHHLLAYQAVLAHRIARHARISAYMLHTDMDMSWEHEVWSNLKGGVWNTALKLTDPQRRSLLDESIALFVTELEAKLQPISALPSGSYSWAALREAVGIAPEVESADMVEENLPVVERYTAIYIFDEVNGRFEFELVPERTYPQRYLSLTIRQFSDGTVQDLTVLASSQGDRLHLSAGGFIENMYIHNEDPLLYFTEIKPAAFWLYQLRRDGDADRRIESAEGFGRVQNDPDVQLILQDLIRNEPDPRVKARLVTSLSEIVGDAFGTNRRFMDLLSDESREVRFAALYALRNYAANEAVQQQVFRIISQSQDIEYVNLAIRVYQQIVSEREFYSVARSLLHEDREELLFTQNIIPLIVQTQQGLLFAPNLLDYLDARYRFDLRRTAFETLMPLEIDAEDWADVLPDLLIDADPRIRYMALSMVAALPPLQREELLTERRYNEFDLRVLNRIQTLIP